MAVGDALKRGYALFTVDLALAEGLNVVWKHASILKDLKLEEVKAVTEDFIRVFDALKIITARELEEKAMSIALEQNIPVYDAIYIAATQKLQGTLYTADQKLHTTANKITNTKLLKPKP